jgi:hypothetical protein
MKFFLSLIFLFLCCTIFSFAQPPEFAEDTIEGESTDSTIVYIIKKAPVTVREKIEIQRNKLHEHLYFSFGLSAFINSNHYNAKNGMEEYVNRLNSSTSSKMGYSSIMQLYNAPEKNIFGFMIEGRRMQENFRYTPENGQENIFENSYTYGSFGVLVGRWYRKDHKLSYQLIGAPSINYKFAVSGYSLNQATDSTIFIEEAIAYNQLYLSLYLSCKVLYKIKNSFVEITPFTNIHPFSMTKKTEAFSIRRNIIGVSIYLTRRIF